MIYSVWKDGFYDYYQVDGWNDPNDPKPRLPRNEVGIAPQQAAWRLPAKAKLVGRGLEARGMVATSGVDDFFGSLKTLAILGVAVYVLWKYGLK